MLSWDINVLFRQSYITAIPKATLNLCENSKNFRLSSSDKKFEGKFLESILCLNIVVREKLKLSKK